MRRASNIRPAQRGMTLIEIAIVLAVMAVMFYYAARGLSKATKTLLREDATRIAATLRAAYAMAAESGQIHRVVFDLEKQVYQIQRCEGPMKLRMTDEEETPDEDELEDLQERMERAQKQMENAQPGTLSPTTSDMVPEIVGADSPAAAAEAAAALAGIRLGSARCKDPTRADGKADPRGEPYQLDVEKNKVVIRRIYVSHLRDPVKDSLVSINFFPMGSAEKALIEVVNEDADQYTILVDRMTGKVSFRQGEVDADDYMHRDGAGNSEEERR